MKTLRSARSLLVVLFLSLGSNCPHLSAQGTDLGTILGTVKDSSGAVVPNAKIDVTDLATGQIYHYVTNKDGNYHASALQAGHYKVAFQAPGFADSLVSDIDLHGTTSVEASVVLHAATVSTVEVTSEAPVINMENGTIGTLLSPKAVIELPRNSRDIYQFLYINPNITQSNEAGEFKFIGGQSYGASFSVDGQRSNGGIFGSQTQSQPSLESVGELQVLSSTYSAEYAGIANIRVTTKRGTDQYHGSLFYNNVNSALSAWTIADKKAKANFQPTQFQSNYARPRYNNTDLGGSFGGPLPGLKNTWIFAAYERNWNIAPTIESGNVPGYLEQMGDFSAINEVNRPAVPSGVILTPEEIASDTVGGLGKQFNKIPQRLLNPVTTKIVSQYFPAIGPNAKVNGMNGNVQNFQTSAPSHNGQQMGDLRIDHNFNDANRIYGVYHGSAQNTAASPVAAPYTGLGLLQTDRLNSTVSLSYTHVFSSNMVNEVRGGYNLQHLYTHANTTVEDFLSGIGFSDADIAAYGDVVGASQLTVHGNPVINFGYSSFSNGSRSSDRNLNQNLQTFGDTLTWTHGRHTFRMGADFVRNQAVDGFASTRSNPQGTISYRGNATDQFAQFLMGLPAFSAASVFNPRPPMDVHNWENGFFFQDDFRVSSRLTLNLGLRYDLYNPYIEKNDLIVNFDPNYSANGQNGRYVIPSDKALPYLSPGLKALGVVTASDAGLGTGRGLVRTDTMDFGPRIGIAFRLTNRSVIRGGYGLYYPTSSAHIYRDSIATNEFNQAISISANAENPLSPWPTGSGSTGQTPNKGGVLNGFANTPSANYVPVNLRNPRTQQWNATFEQQLTGRSTVRLSYIGAHQSGQIIAVDLSELPPSDNPFGTSQDPTGNGGIADGKSPCDPTGEYGGYGCTPSAADNARLKFPQLGDFVSGFGNMGYSNTASFQTQFEHHANHLNFSATYTYLDQKATGLDLGQDSLGGSAYDPFHPNADYSQDSWTSKNRVVAYAVYDLPVGRGQLLARNATGFTNALIGGWQTTMNMFAKSGVPFTPHWDCGDCDPIQPGNVFSGSVDAVGAGNGSSYRPIIIGDPRKNVPKGYQWNPAAFALPGVGADIFSNPDAAKRNSLIGPGTYGVNFGVHKTVAIKDRFNVQIGADFDNLFNHQMHSPDQNFGLASGLYGPSYTSLGNFNLLVDQSAPAPGQQPRLQPINPGPNGNDLTYNNAERNGADYGNFGQNNQSFSQEGVSATRQIRLRARITF